MIMENTHWTTHCDSCNTAFRYSMPTRDSQIGALRRADWWTGGPLGGGALCPECLSRFNACVKTFGQSPAPCFPPQEFKKEGAT